MTEIRTPELNILDSQNKTNKGKIIIFSIVIALICGILGIGVAYGQSFRNRVLPGTRIGSFDIGGMTEGELSTFVADMYGKLLAKGVQVTLDTGTSTKDFVVYPPHSLSEETVIEFVEIDPHAAAQVLVAQNKTGNIFIDSFRALHSLIFHPSYEVGAITYYEDQLFSEIDKNIAPFVNPMVNAGVRISSVSPLKYEITSSSRGTALNYEYISETVRESWSHLEQPKMYLETEEVDPLITEADVEGVIDTLSDAFDEGVLSLEYFNSSTKRPYAWKITPASLSRMIEVEKTSDNQFVFRLSSSSTYAYLHNVVAPTVDVLPQNAKFAISDDKKVTEFKGSHPGVTVDVEKTYELLRDVFIGRFDDTTSTQKIVVQTKIVEPEIKTGEVNDLGITEVLGVGQSIFKGSPGNRYKNIRHAAFDKLDGYIIKPGEEFSLLDALKPFTLAGGYLPELAIKGDRLVPEIGGGLCQIGTTMFRAAMNAGLEITERRNHSLMISYYNDLTNGLPGTDATIYDPGTDFKFKNDTGHHILITSELVNSTGDLFFTLWGTSDGRKGYYIPPTLVRRIPTGPTKIVETTELPPGKKECQHAYPGAEAYFTYVREMPDGEKKEVVYSSYYRPLPETCLVGKELPQIVEETAPEEELSPIEDGVDVPPPSTEESIPLEG